jgi:hypothetical protein
MTSPGSTKDTTRHFSMCTGGPDSLRRQDRGPSWAGASLSLLSSWRCHVYHSIQVRSSTEAGLRIRVCWLREPGIAQGQPCAGDQHLAVELWQAPASCWWTFGRQNPKDSQTFQVRNVPARLEDPAGLEACRRRGGGQLKRHDIHIPDYYQSYTCHIWILSKTCIRRDCMMPPA